MGEKYIMLKMKTTPPTLLLSNDDGIHAEGLIALEAIARTLTDDIWIVAPELEQSGAGHSLTINAPLRYRQITQRKFAVHGTPTDCVLMALRAIIPAEVTVDLVLSGVNRGQNIAEDITHSGTIAAAMEATLCNIPAIALSQRMDYDAITPAIHWETAKSHAPALIKQLLQEPWTKNTLYNLNFPECLPEAVKGVKVVPHGKRKIPKQLTRCMDPKQRPYYWMNWAEEMPSQDRPNSDIHWLPKDYITVTPICLDLTNYDALAAIKGKIER